jgi:hypothetical protein
MLAAYVQLSDPSALLKDAITQARSWVAHSRQRVSCDDAYSDLLLATERYGAARLLASLIDEPTARIAALATTDRLMAELLTRSHELRVTCRAPIAR